jgi:hypothetical protein
MRQLNVVARHAQLRYGFEGRNGVERQLSSPCLFGLQEKRRMMCAKALVPALPVTTYASQPCSTRSPSISSQYAK